MSGLSVLTMWLALVAQVPVPGGGAVPVEAAPEIGVRPLRSDLKPIGGATVGPDETGYVLVGSDQCRFGATSNLESIDTASAGAVWRVSVHTLDHAGDLFVVSASWERLWERGQKLSNGPKGTQQLSLKLGERVMLDSVVPAVTSPCGVVETQLQASVSLHPSARSGGGFSGTGGARASQAGQITPLDQLASKGISADLWLVYTRPDGTEEAQRRTFAAGGSPDYTFAPVSITTTRGTFNVEVKGSLFSTGSAADHISLLIDRRISAVATGGTTARTTGVQQFARPAPSEVLAFELPVPQWELTNPTYARMRPTETADLQLLAGHKFSLRLRVGANK